MKAYTKLFPLCAASAIWLAGCATQAHYVESDSSRLVTEVGRVNIQDFAKAADKMVDSLIDRVINENKLQSAVAGQPALLAISLIQNKTGQQLDTDLLTKKIRVRLNETGKVQTYLSANLGKPEDPTGRDLGNAEIFLDDQKHPRRPDYTLSGKIIEDRARAGNIRQSAFFFQLSLAKGAIAVWEKEEPIIKQGNKPAVGF